MIVRFTPAARQDFRSIGDYIAQADRRRAQTFVRELRLRCMKLADFPRRFPLVPRHENTGIHRFVHGNYLVFYRVDPRAVAILRILHGAQDYEALLFPS